MCDELTEQENDRYLTRREFGRMAAAITAAAMLPPVANAMAVVEQDVMIETPDGMADAYFVHPASGKHPAVLVWTDVLALRPAFREMGKRLAQSGYSVLTPNPYYRSQKAPVVEPGASFRDAETRERVLPMARSLTAETMVTDGLTFIDYLDAHASVDTSRGIGTTGYSMGGPFTMRTAAARPDRVKAGASFHGSRVVQDSEDSPHHVIPQMKAQYLFAIAENDDERNPDEKVVLREAFDAAGLKAEIEVYEGAMHGWCALDSRVYNQAQAERAWGRLLALFDEAL